MITHTPTDDPNPNDLPKVPVTNADEEAFENPSTDPGFEPSYTEEPQEEEDPTEDNTPDADALNYKNDRDHGTYDPRII